MNIRKGTRVFKKETFKKLSAGLVSPKAMQVLVCIFSSLYLTAYADVYVLESAWPCLIVFGGSLTVFGILTYAAGRFFRLTLRLDSMLLSLAAAALILAGCKNILFPPSIYISLTAETAGEICLCDVVVDGENIPVGQAEVVENSGWLYREQTDNFMVWPEEDGTENRLTLHFSGTEVHLGFPYTPYAGSVAIESSAEGGGTWDLRCPEWAKGEAVQYADLLFSLSYSLWELLVYGIGILSIFAFLVIWKSLASSVNKCLVAYAFLFYICVAGSKMKIMWESIVGFLSVDFLLFAAITVWLYYLIPIKQRWFVLLGASLYFYCSSGPEKMLFVFAAAGIAYITTHSIAKNYDGAEPDRRKAKRHLRLGVVLIILFWLYAKIGDAAMEAVVSIFRMEKIEFQALIPLGISYYTFSVIGYMADVYWRKEEAEKDYLKLLLYMIYFPHILQGPISRHKRLASQLTEGHAFRYRNLCHGLQRMGWGYFKKLVIADRLALLTGEVFGNYTSYEGFVFVIALVCAAIELYCDFSGCMDIALGISEALSIRLDENFQRPFFARNAAEFWRRWHITLGAWFRDYIFMPLVISPGLTKFCQAVKEKFGNQIAKRLMTIVPLAVVWMLTGLWHGTGMNYILWGIYWGTLIILSTIFGPEMKKWTKKRKWNTESRWFRIFQTVRTFLLFLISRLLTAPGDIGVTLGIAKRMFAGWNPGVLFDGTLCRIGLDKPDMWVVAIAVLILWTVEILQERGVKIRDKLGAAPLALRWGVYYAGILAILIWGVYSGGTDTFVYMNY